MAAYEYIALDARGKQKKGVLEADSVRQIRQLLRDQGLVPLEVDAAREQQSKGGFSLASFGRRLGALDRVLRARPPARPAPRFRRAAGRAELLSVRAP